MGGVNDVLIVVLLLLEVVLLSFLESKTWNTIFTPLNFLMYPYVLVLLLTIIIVQSGIADNIFYYPSVFLWIFGLIIFAIPSYVIGYYFKKGGMTVAGIQDDKNSNISVFLVVLSVILIVLFAWHTKSLLNVSNESIGSDNFGEEFGGGGIWGHLRQITIPLLILSIYHLDRNHRWLWLLIILFIAINLLNQVKGWVIIPVLTGLFMRLYDGKSRLSSKFLVYVLLACFIFFSLSYVLSLMLALNRGMSSGLADFILHHFLHYLTSGTLGLSTDVLNGFPDKGSDISILFSQFVNLVNICSGDELVSPINPLFYYTGFSMTNVRTLFGTVFINSDCISFVLLVSLLSVFMYLLMLAQMKYHNDYLKLIYFFYCGLLFMGWFDWYFASLVIVEVPVIVILFHYGSLVFHKTI